MGGTGDHYGKRKELATERQVLHHPVKRRIYKLIVECVYRRSRKPGGRRSGEKLINGNCVRVEQKKQLWCDYK